MNILTISECFPYPPDDGTKIQIFERIRALSAENKITLLAGSSEQISEERLREMQRYCRCLLCDVPSVRKPQTTLGRLHKLAVSVFTGRPYFLSESFSRQLAQQAAVCTRDGSFDVVEADIFASRYLRFVKQGLRISILHSISRSCRTREVAQTKNLLAKLIISIYGRLVERFEAETVKAADLCVTLTRHNLLDFQQLHRRKRVRHCLANGVDLEYFQYSSPICPPVGACFVGKMDYAPNIDAVLWFSQAVLPLIRTQIPEFRFTIVGSAPDSRVKDLARLPGVCVTGYVGDVRPHMQSMGIVVVPMRLGGGILNKLLQAMACGLPIVATSAALEGTEAVPSRHLLTAESAGEFASAVIRLAQDPALSQSLSRQGRAYVEGAHQWNTSVKAYINELQQLHSEFAGRVSPSPIHA